MKLRLRQVLTVARLEGRRAFFSKRAWWVYVLAFFPALLYLVNGSHIISMRARYVASGITPAAALDSIPEKVTEQEVRARLGKPVEDREWAVRAKPPIRWRTLVYFDGVRCAYFAFKDGGPGSRRIMPFQSLEDNRSRFAFIFQNFTLRLNVFFGCLGIFMNLFRGKMLNKTLHFWLLAPVRREVLLVGKYLAGLVAASLIFTVSTLLSFGLMLWAHQPSEVQVFWQAHGPAHALSYAAATVLACVGYGSLFLGAGLLVRNPVIPAVVLLLWESVSGFMPSMLQKVSVLYYVRALCPVQPTDPKMSALVQLFFSPAAPPSKTLAVGGLLLVTAIVLWLSARAVRKLEINYSTD